MRTSLRGAKEKFAIPLYSIWWPCDKAFVLYNYFVNHLVYFNVSAFAENL